MAVCPYPLVHGKCPPEPDTFFAFGYSGVYTFAAVIGTLTSYAIYVWIKRVKSRKGKMSGVHAGGFRFAAAQGNVPAMIYIKNNAPHFDVNTALHGWTALHAAAIQGHAHVITWLVNNGADINVIKTDDWNDSLLHYAAANGHQECVETLLSVGADPTATNFEGATPADLARKGGYGDLAKILIEAASDWIRRESFRMTALQLKEDAEMHNDGLGSSFRREVAQLDRILNEAAGPPPEGENNDRLSTIDESGSSFGTGPHSENSGPHSGPISGSSVSGGSSPDSRPLSAASPPNELEMASLAREYNLKPASQVQLTVAVKTHPEPKPEEVKKADTPKDVDKDVPEDSWIIANRKEPEGWSSMRKEHTPEDERTFKEYINRGWEGLGTEGTQLRSGWPLFRASAIVCQSLGVIYIVWRAIRTFNIESLWLSVPFYMAELVSFIPSFIFCLEVWCPAYRPPRNLSQMDGLTEADYPSVDIIIVCYSEPVDIVEATACAALNLDYPADKLTVYICDDGKKDEMRAMAHRLEFQRRYLKRQAPLIYVSRTKVKGISHHAKAGNINNLLLKGGARGDFVVVFDCDMIPKREFLLRTIPHFFRTKPGGGWEQKNRAGFLQTPQDFYNLEANDPFGNRARFFYGPMMQGRDGVGSCPCVGTGVIFRREALISMGGQAYGSITEDYNSAMGLLGGGFSSMFLNELLIFGIAPDDVMTVLTQRQRWAMGSLQILCLDNPLLNGGLTIPQSLLFFQSCIQYTLALPTLLMALVPILFLFSGISPIHAKVHEFLVFFIGYYLANRIMLFLAHRGVPNAGMEMWRGSQQWVWLVPNNLVSCWKAFSTELAIFKFFKLGKLGFTVTNKDGNDDWREALKVTWPFFTYYIGMTAGIIYTIVFVGIGSYGIEAAASRVVAFAWGILVCMYIWPPIEGSPPISNISWLHGAKHTGGAVKWENDTSLASPGSHASPKTPGPARRLSFQRLKSFGRMPSIKKQNVEDLEAPQIAEAIAIVPSTPGRNGLLMTRQQVIPIEERELSLLYQMVRKNETGGQPVVSPASNAPAMSPVELPRSAIPEEEELETVAVKSPVVTPRGSPTESDTSSERSSKMEQFKKMQGISLMSLDGAADVAIDIADQSPENPIEDPRAAHARNPLGALLTGRRVGPAALNAPAAAKKSPISRALDALALPTPRAPGPTARAEPATPVMPSPKVATPPVAIEEYYSLVTPRLRARTSPQLRARISPQLRPRSGASTPRSARASPRVNNLEEVVLASPLLLGAGRKEKDWPSDNESEGFEEFKEKMTTRATYIDHASLHARPVFELKAAKTAGGEGMRPHVTFVVVNTLLLAGFIAGGVVYVFKLSLDSSWLGIH
ncbi:cellulose synthase catalytic subunit [Klebsormidium nitens]|uniref:Cellulose synthase catalytic subunit n=1 Tax=Klebsormidium nitens TaxID=105231 RepID=A0A1Y1IJT9_KLENI|nr:cellulose synthase catalytic subunit [Klebsormidium nitens]|eukprot:GAQ89401.1 cellulose synthase catalytic subunit [Klebsormidium nitens]